MFALKPSSTPYNLSLNLHRSKSSFYHDSTQYRILIGQLIYLTTTRPDITFVVQQLSHFVSKPNVTHFETVIRILQYLKSCPSKGLFYPSATNILFLVLQIVIGLLAQPHEICYRFCHLSRKISHLVEIQEANNHFSLQLSSRIYSPCQYHL